MTSTGKDHDWPSRAQRLEDVYEDLIREGRDLLGVEDDAWVEGDNPEYARGVVELIVRVCGLTHNEDTARVCADLGIKEIV